MLVETYRGNFEQVKQRIREDYLLDDVELCSFFESTTPNLTISEVVRLFAQLCKEIDNDSVLLISEGNATDLSE